VLELVNALSDPADRAKVHAAVAEIRSSENWEMVEGSRLLFSETVLFHRRRSDKHWSLTDCASFIVMQERGVSSALAHDRHFEQAGFEALLRRDP
jgi:predicted nucleic acid-binding protein